MHNPKKRMIPHFINEFCGSIKNPIVTNAVQTTNSIMVFALLGFNISVSAPIFFGSIFKYNY
ncbi:MAG: hypothetical protein CL530_07455 [Aequorivita sp.]|nr:hypothetical protein [Aequorivita sp.]